jgi:ABC-type phosphate transport system permease subunit
MPVTHSRAARRPERLVFALPLVVAATGMVVAFLTVFVNDTDALIALLLALLAIALVAAAQVRRARTGVLDRPLVALAVVSLVAAVVAVLLPVWMFGGDVNGIVNRTVVSGPLLLLLGTGSAAFSIRQLLGASPSGQDVALVPIFAVAIVLGVMGYVLVLGRIVVSGLGSFRFDLLTTAWHQNPSTNGFTYDIGFLNNILGTFLLIGLTLLFAMLPGVGAGVFMSEYPGRTARIVNFCTTMLRAISMFIIGAAALGVVRLGSGLDSSSFMSLVIRGGFNDQTDIQAERGSFVLAAVFLAMLVMPIIARLTEEGLRSVPREMREGTVALGATEGYGLRRILLPWAAPNILTALILAGAEAAGGLAILMFLAVPGQNGVGPFSGVTSLDYSVFATHYGPRVYFDSMREYQYTAALLLLVLTVGLTLVAMTLQQRFTKRYRGFITAQ